MKKKIIIIAIVTLVIIAASGVIWFVASSSDRIHATVTCPVDKSGETSYIYQVDFLDRQKASRKQLKWIWKMDDDLTVLYDEFRNVQQKPYYVEAKYENIDGKTVITFRGEITDKETGKLVPYEKVLTYDYIITENINTNENDVLKYFD